MNKRIVIFIKVVLLIVAPLLSFGQYFQGLYDFDSSYDWGENIFLQANGTYLVYGTSLMPIPYKWGLINMNISADGISTLNKNLLLNDDFSLYMGNPGATKSLREGGFVGPISGQNRSFTNCWAGLIKYDTDGSIEFLKTYTDTPLYADDMVACAIMPDKGYSIGGEHGLTASEYLHAYIVRTDSVGDSLWTHTYLYDTNSTEYINDIIPLADGRIVVGASSNYTPWFLLLDSLGNIVRDTVYETFYIGGGFIYADKNGGYFCIGVYDTTYSSDPDDFRNYPTYLAHLDTNFRMTWLHRFTYYPDSGNRQAFVAKQLQDSSYIVIGDMWPNATGYLGWAAKVNRNGEQVWSNSYLSDSNDFAHFRGMVEKPDGSLVFVGESFNDTLPSWRQGEDVWLVGTDSNGCQNAFCAPTAVKPLTRPSAGFSVWPNPTTGNFAINAPEAGVIEVYTIQGQQVSTYKITQTETTLQLPGGIAAGVYFVKYISGGGNNAPVVVRLIKE